ncbi:MAG: hypothetical protein II951_00520 [Bacteroidales bacterium]|nr:hypothetical protein [Bacteroidales bacterium]
MSVAEDSRLSSLDFVSVFAAFILLSLLGWQTGIFWDNVLFVSKIGGFLYSNSISDWFSLPVNIDPGHPLLPSSVLAAVWHVCGRSLAVSHLAVLPLVFCTLWQLMRLVAFFFPRSSHRLLCFALLLADPTLLSSLSLVGPEVFLLAFFFLALNSILRGELLLKGLALALLSLTSLRGMMLCGSLFLIDVFLPLSLRPSRFLSRPNVVCYLVAALPSLLFLLGRLCFNGWIISNPSDQWGDAFGFDSSSDFFSNLLRNLVVLAHRFLDFGRWPVVLFVVVMLILGLRSSLSVRVRSVLLMASLSALIVGGVSLFINNSIGHRYFTASYVLVALLAFEFLVSLPRLRVFLLPAFFVSLLTGNFWVYPDSMAQGWDASLAHLNYWGLRRNVAGYMHRHDISTAETATFYPNYVPSDYIFMDGDTVSPREFSGSEDYVLFSNVYNTAKDALPQIVESYVPDTSLSSLNVRVVLWRRKSLIR